MTKKDYELLATSLGRYAHNVQSDSDKELILSVANNLSLDLRRTNPRFSPDRFNEWVREVANGTRNRITGQRVIVDLQLPT